MLRRHVREKASHNRTQTVRDSLHQSRALSQAHHAQPQCHDADQTERDGNRRFGAVERALGHVFQAIVPAANCDREQNEGEPNVIEHALFVAPKTFEASRY